MKKFLLSILVACASLSTFAQENAAADTAKSHRHHRHHRNGVVFEGNDKKPKVQLYGFVRNYFTYDSHTVQAVNGGLFHTLPTDESLNLKEEDLNQQSSLQWQAFTTRLGLNLQGPRLNEDCTMSGKIEMDFCGYGSYTYLLRIRQAYMRLAWKKNMLTLGQTWHPMFNADMMPACAALSTGSPFQPFNRSPQIRHDVRFGKDNGWRWTTDLLWMLQYTPVGPTTEAERKKEPTTLSTANIKFLNNSCVPELYFGLDHTGKKVTVGVGADFTCLKPRQNRTEITITSHTDSSFVDDKWEYETKNDTAKCDYKSSDRITAISPMFYFQYKPSSKFKLMAKAVYGQNTAHLNMPSGYGLSEVNKETGECKYTPLRMFSTWINPVWTNTSKNTGNITKVSFYAGYQKNLGSKDPMIEEYVKYTSLQHKGGKTLDNCFRFCPTYSYSIKCFEMAFEYELTGATYGKEEKNNEGLWMGKTTGEDLNTVINNRICAMVKYNF